MMPSWLVRVREGISPWARRDRSNAHALAVRLGVDDADGAWIYRRSREVGYPAALAAYEELCRERSQATTDHRPA